MWSVYTKQFEPGVWAAMVVVVAAAVVCLRLASRPSPRQQNATLSDSAFTVLGFVFGQGEELLPNRRMRQVIMRW